MLIVDGLHVPVILLIEINGNVGEGLFKHNGPMAANKGSTESVISMSRVTVFLHSPASGVKV